MLTSKELSNLTNFLFNGQYPNKTFDSISASFHKTFVKSDYFKLGKSVIALLSSDLLADNLPKTLAVFLLWDMYKSDSLENNPFLPFILDFLKNDSSSKQCRFPISAKLFMLTLMRYTDRIKDLFKMTPVQVLSMGSDLASLHACDLSIFDSLLREKLKKVPKVDLCGIPCIVPDEEVLSLLCERNITSALQRKHCLENLLSNEVLLPALLQSLRPEFLRIVPPLLPCPQASTPSPLTTEDSPPGTSNVWTEEFVWLCPLTVNHHFHWDSTMGHSSPPAEICQLASIALTSSLSPSQKEVLVQAIAENPSMVHSVGLTIENVCSFITLFLFHYPNNLFGH
uniref:CCR4-NOT transcription complex subunit 11 n=1 Tax=Mesocestoides corti TaxID=53468 RepID=A0A5K3FMY1_MESCO